MNEARILANSHFPMLLTITAQKENLGLQQWDNGATKFISLNRVCGVHKITPK